MEGVPLFFRETLILKGFKPVGEWGRPLKTINMDKEPRVGDILRDNVIIARVWEQEDRYDLEVIDRDTDDSGHCTIYKKP